MNTIQIDIPYWNELHAGSVGSLSSFNDNTPVATVENSLLNLLNWLTPGNQSRTPWTLSSFQDDRITSPQVWDRVIREGQQQTNTPGTVSDAQRRFPSTGGIAGGYPGDLSQAPEVPHVDPRTGEIMSGAPMTQDEVNKRGASFGLDIAGALNDFLTGDIAKRTGLLLLATLLIVVAILSLR
jgi:hypothetical protein